MISLYEFVLEERVILSSESQFTYVNISVVLSNVGEGFSYGMASYPLVLIAVQLHLPMTG